MRTRNTLPYDIGKHRILRSPTIRWHCDENARGLPLLTEVAEQFQAFATFWTPTTRAAACQYRCATGATNQKLSTNMVRPTGSPFKITFGTSEVAAKHVIEWLEIGWV